MALSAFKRRVDRISRAYRAVLIILGGLPLADRRELDAELEAIPALTKRSLVAIEEVRGAALREMDEAVGFLAPLDEYIRIVEEAIASPYDIYFMPRVYIDKKLFRNAAKFSPDWNLYAPHTSFGMDARGELAFTGTLVEWRLLEAALFEDLATLWNECLDHETPKTDLVREGRIPFKKFNVLKRSTVRAVFSLLEGYINGIAVDIEWTADPSSLTPAERELVAERSDDGRSKFKRLRDKILQYPKIAIGAQHPPIQDSTPEFALILKRERDWRDAIMHPTPRAEDDREISRQESFFEIQLGDLRELIDATIALIRKIDTVLDGKFGTVKVWITERGEDGRFPKNVFF